MYFTFLSRLHTYFEEYVLAKLFSSVYTYGEIFFNLAYMLLIIIHLLKEKPNTFSILPVGNGYWRPYFEGAFTHYYSLYMSLLFPFI